jgi:nucleoside permease NupC
MEFLGLSTTHSAVLVAWTLYLILALCLNFSAALPFALSTAFCMAWYLMTYFKESIPVPEAPELCCLGILSALGALALGIVSYQVITASADMRMSKVQSVIGFCVLLGVSVLSSKNRSNIPWRLVSAGLLCQFYLGLFVFKTDAGYHFFRSMGDYVTAFLAFADVGAKFVFGAEMCDPRNGVFAVLVLPKTVFFSAFCSCLYYLGILQATVKVVAAVLHCALGSSLPESVNAAGNIFLGQTEAPLLVRNILPTATASEIHCIMTGGFATVAGSVLAAYISMGVNASQLIGASVMSAPAALTISKIVCPSGVTVDDSGSIALDEPSDSTPPVDSGSTALVDADAEKAMLDDNVRTDDSRDASSSAAVDADFFFPAPAEKNLVEAAANGASLAIGLAANIAAMLVAFIALIAFLDAMLGNFGAMVNVKLSFQIVCSWMFYPIAWILGTPLEDCGTVASLIGTKLSVNEFMAYNHLSLMLPKENDGVMTERTISHRGELVATYALCGFSNFASIGIQVGGLSALVPEKKKVYVALVFSAMIAGNTCCFLTAAVAGILS